MPALQPPARILVTGATGYVAVWVVRSLLNAGFSVRGTARSASKAEFVRKLFAKETEAGRFDTVIVKDIAQPGAFDEAVRGIDGIAHTASPFHFKADDPDELIKPAVQGTIGVLESVVKHNKGVKRVIVLSSTAAVTQPNGGHPLTEQNWNEPSIEAVNTKGRDAANHFKYSASKTLAERAAWEYYAKHKDQVGWDLVSLNPPFIYGPTIHEIPSLSSLNTSMADLFTVLCQPHAGGRTDEQLASNGVPYVDVRDIAAAHTKAFLNEKAGGERIIISAGTATWQQFLDAAHKAYPQAHAIYAGRPGAGEDISQLNRFDANKSSKLLGIEYLGLEDTVRDSIADFTQRGWFDLA